MPIGSRVWEEKEIKTGKLVGGMLAATLLLCGAAVANSQEQSAAPNAQAAPEQAQAPAASSQAPQAEPQGAAPLRVLVGKSLLINTTERLRRVSVTDDTIADALVVTPTQILVHGRAPGEVSLLIWDELERSRSFDLRVETSLTTIHPPINLLINLLHFNVPRSDPMSPSI